jgi:hypothetical protein
VRVGIPSLRESGGSTLRGKLGARGFFGFVCVAPLRLGGLRGKKSTPSIGWEVPLSFICDPLVFLTVAWACLIIYIFLFLPSSRMNGCCDMSWILIMI